MGCRPGSLGSSLAEAAGEGVAAQIIPVNYPMFWDMRTLLPLFGISEPGTRKM